MMVEIGWTPNMVPVGTRDIRGTLGKPGKEESP